jgi:hypothetical protein
MGALRKWGNTTGSGGNRHRGRGERGAALAEMALLMPILLMLILGVFELGGAFKSYLTTSNAVRDGTRILSARGTDETGDCIAVVKAAEALALANNLSRLDRIEIFEATTAGDPIPGTVNTYRLTGTDPSVCASTAPNCGSWACTIQQLPSARNALVGANTSPDLIGMRMVYIHNWLTGFPPFSGSISIDEQTISRLEPEGFAP